jgi:hypothetical protein
MQFHHKVLKWKRKILHSFHCQLGSPYKINYRNKVIQCLVLEIENYLPPPVKYLLMLTASIHSLP